MVLNFDEHMKAYSKADQYDSKPNSPAFFGLDGFELSGFYRPPVWTGAGNAADGLLGCQAPAADGLDLDPFTLHPHPREPTLQEHEEGQQQQLLLQQQQLLQLQLQTSPESAPLAKGKTPARGIPRFPPEIHNEILTHVLESTENTNCSYCHLFELSTLSQVSRLYHMMVQPYLYDTLHLDFTSSIDSNLSLIHHDDQRHICAAHLKLASKHLQLEQRVPLLVRTLTSRPDIASRVRKLVLPAGGVQTFLTCALEKTLLPDLISCCPNLAEVDGVENLLIRQFFSGEHYCFDGQDPQQHGVLAKALHEKKTLRRWCWAGGNAGGSPREFWSRMWDRHPAMAATDFTAMHRHWTHLETLEIRNVWNIDVPTIQKIISGLKCLRKVALVGVRKKRTGRGDAGTILAALEILPSSVKEVELGNVAEESFLSAVGEWVRVRHTIKEFSMLEALKVTHVPITPATLGGFLKAISVRKVTGFRSRLSYIPLLDFTPRSCSVVKCLALDNVGFEDAFGSAMDYTEDVGMELCGLEELDWRIRGFEEGHLASRLRRGCFRDLRRLAGEGCEAAAAERGIGLV